MSNRNVPPPVVDNNPPARRRPPADPSTDVSPHSDRSPSPTVGTNVGNNVGTSVPKVSGPAPAQAIDALMHGRLDPDDDLVQNGVRIRRYVDDALRVVVATSRGRLTKQDIVHQALKAYLPYDVLYAAWLRHGGEPASEPQQ